MQKPVKRILGILAALLLFTNCTTTITTRTIEMDYEQDVRKSELMIVITSVLLDNGFAIDATDSVHGIITTDLRREHPYGTDLAQTSLLYAALGVRIYVDALFITFKLTDRGYIVYPDLVLVDKIYNLPNGSIYAPEEDSWAGKLTNKIITEISAKINLPATIVWLEEIEELHW